MRGNVAGPLRIRFAVREAERAGKDLVSVRWVSIDTVRTVIEQFDDAL